MNNIDKTILIGGKAGAGIKEAGRMFGSVLSDLGFFTFTYVDYQSLIRGGHNFVSIRFSNREVNSIKKHPDVIVATDTRTIKEHKEEAKEDTLWLIDIVDNLDNAIKVPFKEVAPGFFKSSSVLGALLKLFGIPIENGLPYIKSLKEPEKNEEIYKEAYDKTPTKFKIQYPVGPKRDVYSPSDCFALGAIDAGLEFYVAYPMTPSTPVLHFLASKQKELNIKVIQPESEIGVINMAAGISYAGKRVAVGSSGGGFALMTEAVSMFSMAELPILIYEAQRLGPSTGLPTYTSQGDLLFVLFSSPGDTQRIVMAPGDACESYVMATDGLNLAWKFQVPVFVLSDKYLAENYYTQTFERKPMKEEPILWDKKETYKRYKVTQNFVSPLAFPGEKDAVVKVNSYEHTEDGITTEDIKETIVMQEKRFNKKNLIDQYIIENYKTIDIKGNKNSDIALITFGSNKGVCEEISNILGIKLIRPLFLDPFPKEQIHRELEGIKKVICVEMSINKQFEKLLNMYDIKVDKNITKYDGRPFYEDDLLEEIKGKI